MKSPYIKLKMGGYFVQEYFVQEEICTGIQREFEIEEFQGLSLSFLEIIKLEQYVDWEEYWTGN